MLRANNKNMRTLLMKSADNWKAGSRDVSFKTSSKILSEIFYLNPCLLKLLNHSHPRTLGREGSHKLSGLSETNELRLDPLCTLRFFYLHSCTGGESYKRSHSKDLSETYIQTSYHLIPYAI